MFYAARLNEPVGKAERQCDQIICSMCGHLGTTMKICQIGKYLPKGTLKI